MRCYGSISIISVMCETLKSVDWQWSFRKEEEKNLQKLGLWRRVHIIYYVVTDNVRSDTFWSMKLILKGTRLVFHTRTEDNFSIAWNRWQEQDPQKKKTCWDWRYRWVNIDFISCQRLWRSFHALIPPLCDRSRVLVWRKQRVFDVMNRTPEGHRRNTVI